MKKLNYSRLDYTDITKISSVVLRHFEKETGYGIKDIKRLAYYKYGPYSKQPLIFFLNDGSIYKINNSLKIQKI